MGRQTIPNLNFNTAVIDCVFETKPWNATWERLQHFSPFGNIVTPVTLQSRELQFSRFKVEIDIF